MGHSRLYRNTVLLQKVAITILESVTKGGRDATQLYLFYRGNWCPFCMAQIREVVTQYQEIAQRGVHVVLISPQSHGKTKQLAKKFDVPMTFLVNVENRAARQFGIAHEHGVPSGMELLGYDSETALPTLILVDENGRILATNQTDNYRIRPDPVEFLHILDNLT